MLGGLVKAMRPHQWVKNLFVLAPLVFAQHLFDLPMAFRAAVGFMAFSLLASSVYIMNDVADVEADRAHPVKKNRPIASGRVPLGVARNFGIGLGLIALIVGFVTSVWFGICAISYAVLNVAYSAKLKRIAYLDVICIALGFELRVLSGAFAAQVRPSGYLLLVTFLLATFLGLGKRMHELMQGESAHKQRKVLKMYDKKALTALLVVTALATITTYAIYSVDPDTRRMFDTDYLVMTTPFTVFGVLRFLHLVRNKPHAESPTEEMLRDKPFLANLILWAIAIVVVVYFT